MHVQLTEPVHDVVDPGPGRHLWMITTAFNAPDNALQRLAAGEDPGRILLDHETLMFPPAIGCYKCEAPFTPGLYARKCSGSMEVQQP